MPGLSDSPSNMIAKTMYRRELFCGDTWFTSQKSFAVRSALLEASGASGQHHSEARGNILRLAYKVQTVVEPLPQTELRTMVRQIARIVEPFLRDFDLLIY
jgi:hypothetical protein